MEKYQEKEHKNHLERLAQIHTRHKKGQKELSTSLTKKKKRAVELSNFCI